MKILIADDSSTSRQIIKKALAPLNLEVLELADGTDVIPTLEANPDTILVALDYNMPTISGMTALEAIRQHPRFKAMPVVMVTASSDKEFVIRAIRTGATQYITKPFKEDLLLKRISDLLQIDPQE